MPSERMQRQIDRLLDEAEKAAAEKGWAHVADCAREVLAVDAGNEDAVAFLSMAERQGNLPQRETRGPAASSSADSAPAPTLPASFASGRYAVRRFLGEGGRKRVYLAYDEKLDRDVAFAAIKTDGLDADGITRIRREAQAMGRLGDHPHIVTVFDTGEDNGQPYIVSQYMAGGELSRLIDEAERRRLPIVDAVRIATQVAQGLEHAHAHGIVHRDLKPGNIWLTATGVVKIGDFGLALSLDRSRMTMPGTMVGTAAYMPPEQAMGGETTAASDLYAFGCVLYELVTGRPPFVGDEAVAVISQHVNTPPVAPTWHTPECPPGLETLITRLLAKDPVQRPASATEVLQALASVDVQSAPAAAAVPSEAATSGGIYARTFVGREAELRQLQAAFDGALSGEGALVMVVGEPGIGKTAVTEQLLTYVAMRGGRTLVGHCYEEGSLTLPYLPFVEAMRSYALVLERDQLQEELGTGAGDVARIVSEIRDRVAVEMPPPGNPEEERFRLFQAVTAFLRNASAAQALCIVLEDLQDGDKGTMELLVHLARNLSGARLLIVGTYRDVEVDRRHPLSAALADLRRVKSFARIPLRGLSIDQVHRMMSNLAGQEVTLALAEGIYRQTEGNPLFIQEVMRYIRESGLARREGGQWVTTVDSLLTQIPEGLRDVIGKRLSRLSDECNRILSVAAVMGRDFSLDVLRDVAGVPEEQLLSAIEEAIGVSVLEERTEARDVRYRFTHAYFRQTLYGEMIAPRRLRLHNDVAKALERHYSNRLEGHAAELAEHFSHSSSEEDLHKAVKYGEMAATRAASVWAFSEASRLLDQAIEVQEIVAPNDSQKLYDLLMELSASLLSSGEAERVFNETVGRACELAMKLGGGIPAARAAEMAATAMIYHHGTPCFLMPEYAAWCDIMNKNAPPDSRERAMADGWTAWISWARKDSKTTWPLRKSALELARRVGDPQALAYAMFGFTVPGGPITWDEERLSAARELKDMPRTGLQPFMVGQMLWSLADVLADGGDITAAQQIWKELDDYADRVEDPYVRSWQAYALSTQAYFAGDLERSIEIGIDMDNRADSLGIPVWGRLVSSWSKSAALPTLGRLDEMLQVAWAWDVLPWGDAQMAALKAMGGRLDDARRAVDNTIERWRATGEEWTDRITLMALLVAAIRLEDKQLVSELASRLEGAMPYSNNNLCITNGRLLGLAALLLGDPSAARSHFEDGLAVAQKLGVRPEVAIVRQDLARLLFEHFPNERAAAAEHVNFATTEAQAMKIKPLLEECLALKLRFQRITSTDVFTSIDTVARVVEAEKPDLRTHAAPDGTVTIMFSDIEGSTEKTDRLGDKAWMQVLREHNAIVREQLNAHGGFEVKSEGDGFMVAFQSAGKALACASAIQKALLARNDSAAEPVKVRMGLHAGEVIKEGEDFFGRNVIMAARVASQAQGGEILTSAVVKTLMQGSDVAWGEKRTVELKGLSGEHEIWAVEWGS
jgi:class 3 adenylate cyclase